MKRDMYLLENWIFGLFGFEEKTFITVKGLVQKLIAEGNVKIESNLTNYNSGKEYFLKFELREMETKSIKNEENDENLSIIGKIISDLEEANKNDAKLIK